LDEPILLPSETFFVMMGTALHISKFESTVLNVPGGMQNDQEDA
jgi:hypothetical protein